MQVARNTPAKTPPFIAPYQGAGEYAANHGFFRGFRGLGNTCHRLTVYATTDTCHRLTVYATGPHFHFSRVKNFTHPNRTYQHGFFKAVHLIQDGTIHLLTPYLLFRGRCVLLLSLIEFRSPDGVLLYHLRLQIGRDSGCNRFFGHLLT